MRLTIAELLAHVARQEARARRSLSFTPSENVLSPLARVPLVLDAYSRYFFDHLSTFGTWAFYGGLEAGAVELELLAPLLREMSGASYVNTRPISGLSCMAVAIAGLCERGDRMLTIPTSCGGHMSTAALGARFGVEALPLPMHAHDELDLERLADVLRMMRPRLIYLDQSTQLFPIDPQPIRELVERWSPRTRIHYDGSHVNGLVLGGALFNPLVRGAHTFGGSTHKTLPGPHKGFIATDDAALAAQVGRAADDLVSHHHLAESLSLAITLLELRDCDGRGYAAAVLRNARRLAQGLSARGVVVAAADRGFTGCHQVWAAPPAPVDATAVADALYAGGLIVNKLGDIPGFAVPAFRLSSAELTRLGAEDADVDALASLIGDAMTGAQLPPRELSAQVDRVRERLSRPRYCYELDDLEQLDTPHDVLGLCARLM
jgi:glycine/serine hydroxymethyltransferase